MIKLVASDLDGTLLPPQNPVLSSEMIEIVQELQAKGIPFISASGRPLDSQKNLWGEIADDISYIGENGALCIINKELFVVSCLETELAHRMIREISKNPDCKLLISGPKHCYILKSDMEFREYVASHLRFEVILLDDLTQVPEPIVKVAYNHIGGWQESSKFYKEMFGNEAAVVTSGNNWVDLMPLDCNKGACLAFLLNKLGIAPEDVMAFGDQPNDVEMISYVGHGYAMEHGSEETKACAKGITDSVEKVLRAFLDTL